MKIVFLSIYSLLLTSHYLIADIRPTNCSPKLLLYSKVYTTGVIVKGQDCVKLSVRHKGGGINAAVYSQKMDRIYFNFAGKDNYSKASSISLRKVGGVYYFSDKLNYAKATLYIKGSLNSHKRKDSTYYNLKIKIVSAVGDLVSINDKNCSVILIDGNNNMKHDDALVFEKTKKGAYLHSIPDTVCIKYGDKILRGLYGQPIKIEKKWYKITINGKVLVSEEIEVDAAQIILPAGACSGFLVSDKYIYAFKPGMKSLTLPSGKYYLADFVQKPTATSKACLRAYAINKGLIKFVVAKGGELVVLKAGMPVIAQVYTSVRKNKKSNDVRLSFKLTDVNGVKIDSLIGATGKKPTPKVRIINTLGQATFNGTFHYG